MVAGKEEWKVTAKEEWMVEEKKKVVGKEEWMVERKEKWKGDRKRGDRKRVLDTCDRLFEGGKCVACMHTRPSPDKASADKNIDNK